MTLDRESLRDTLEGFDETQKKIVGGLIAIMIENPDQIREREWIAEQFTQVTLLAVNFEDDLGLEQGMWKVQEYVRENVNPLLNACYLLFQVVGEDLAPRVDEGFSREDAVAHALGYFSR
jgi:hypothetical protein